MSAAALDFTSSSHALAPADPARRAGTLADRLWAKLEPALLELKLVVAALDREAIRTGSLGAPGRERLEAAFAAIERLLGVVLDPDVGTPEEIRGQVGARVQAELLPLMLLSENGLFAQCEK